MRLLCLIDGFRDVPEQTQVTREFVPRPNTRAQPGGVHDPGKKYVVDGVGEGSVPRQIDEQGLFRADRAHLEKALGQFVCVALVVLVGVLCLLGLMMI